MYLVIRAIICNIFFKKQIYLLCEKFYLVKIRIM